MSTQEGNLVENGVTHGKSISILLIDDEKIIRDTVMRVLKKAGFVVDTARGLEDTLQYISKKDYDILLVDIILSGIDGIRLAEILQQQYNVTSALIFITGEPSKDSAIHAIRLGAIDYIEKPIEPLELVNRILSAIQRANHKVKFIDRWSEQPISLNQNYLRVLNGDQDELLLKIGYDVQKIYMALKSLKEKYGNSFNEEQRELLNIIALSMSSIRKKIKNYRKDSHRT